MVPPGFDDDLPDEEEEPERLKKKWQDEELDEQIDSLVKLFEKKMPFIFHSN